MYELTKKGCLILASGYVTKKLEDDVLSKYPIIDRLGYYNPAKAIIDHCKGVNYFRNPYVCFSACNSTSYN